MKEHNTQLVGEMNEEGGRSREEGNGLYVREKEKGR